MPRVVHFEVVAGDVERSRKFYSDTFGWVFNKWGEEEYWLIETGKEGPGINGGLVKSKGAPLTVNTMGVDNLDEYIAKVEKNGGKQVVDKTTVPGVGYLAYCSDPDGIVFGLMQPDSSAK